MRGVSNIVGAIIVFSAILLVAAYSVAYIASTGQAARDYVLRAGLSSTQPRMHLELLYCDSDTGFGEAVLTIIGYAPDEPRKAIVVTRSGSGTQYLFNGSTAYIAVPCNEDFMILVETLRGATWVYSLDRDPDYSCLGGYVLNTSVLTLMSSDVSPCDPAASGVGGVFVLNVTSGWWYVVNVLGLPYTIAYTDDGSIVSPVYRWDLDPDYIVFRAPRSGTVVFTPSTMAEADYQEGFDSAEAWLPVSWSGLLEVLAGGGSLNPPYNDTTVAQVIPLRIQYGPKVFYEAGMLGYQVPVLRVLVEQVVGLSETPAECRERPGGLYRCETWGEIVFGELTGSGLELGVYGLASYTGVLEGGEARLYTMLSYNPSSTAVQSLHQETLAALARRLAIQSGDPTPSVTARTLTSISTTGHYVRPALAWDDTIILEFYGDTRVDATTSPILTGEANTLRITTTWFLDSNGEPGEAVSVDKVFFVVLVAMLGPGDEPPGTYLFQQVSTSPPVFQSPAGETIVVIDNPWTVRGGQGGSAAEPIVG